MASDGCAAAAQRGAANGPKTSRPTPETATAPSLQETPATSRVRRLATKGSCTALPTRLLLLDLRETHKQGISAREFLCLIVPTAHLLGHPLQLRYKTLRLALQRLPGAGPTAVTWRERYLLQQRCKACQLADRQVELRPWKHFRHWGTIIAGGTGWRGGDFLESIPSVCRQKSCMPLVNSTCSLATDCTAGRLALLRRRRCGRPHRHLRHCQRSRRYRQQRQWATTTSTRAPACRWRRPRRCPAPPATRCTTGLRRHNFQVSVSLAATSTRWWEDVSCHTMYDQSAWARQQDTSASRR